MKKFLIPFLYILLIFGLALFLRTYDINWDQGTHIHPDERFLTMVGVAMKIPTNFLTYLDPQKSLLNPTNINFSFFVYGIFPLIFTKIYAIIFNFDTYDKFNLLGRGISAIFDALTVLIIFKISFLFKKKYHLPTFFPYLAGFFYAIAVFPIQQSHFFTVDTFSNFFAFTSLSLAIDYWNKKKNSTFILSSIFFGIALSCKITSVYILPLIAYYLILGLFYKYHISFSLKKLLRAPVIPFLMGFIIYALISYISMRITDPYVFETGNFFLPTINKTFLTSLQTLKMYDTPTAWYPPGVQWIHKTPILFGAQNIALYGLGIPYTLFLIAGFFFLLRYYRKTSLSVCFLWTIIIVIFQGLQYVQAMRYYYILYPFFAIIAAIGASTIIKKNVLLLSIILIFVSIWTTAFFSIYTKPLSRVTASEWIYNHIPTGKQFLGELWDDPLPLGVTNTYGNVFPPSILLPVFDPDTPEKWSTMYTDLHKGDYLILSSNRGWGSIPTVPERYPLMTKFYKDLFAGKLQYKKIEEFTSYPSLSYLGIPITFPDNFADESFTVYDHPQVNIFQKM